ncbi:MAG: hypothetical protein RLZZ531_1737 [Bacteroidota bacterium]|jgi:hypothetical protein
MNKIHFITLSILLLFSCQNNEKGKANKVEEPTDKNLQTDFESAKFDTEFCEITTFLNGDSIVQAQSAKEWKEASKGKTAAWCYADPIKKEGILYNYYVLQDKRGIVPDSKKITRDQADKLKKELVQRKKEWTIAFSENGYVQRSFTGQNYNLKFVQFWIFDDADVENNQANIMVWDLKLKTFDIEKVSTNNGYRIWLLK